MKTIIALSLGLIFVLSCGQNIPGKTESAFLAPSPNPSASPDPGNPNYHNCRVEITGTGQTYQANIHHVVTDISYNYFMWNPNVSPYQATLTGSTDSFSLAFIRDSVVSNEAGDIYFLASSGTVNLKAFLDNVKVYETNYVLTGVDANYSFNCF